ncbi:MAG: hemerythrin domain-containing protein [Bdellovibrionota bacterium]
MLIYDALHKDHEVVRGLLNELVALDYSDENRHSGLIEQIRNELIPHSRAEEKIFYNSLREMDTGKDVVMHGFQEHMEAEMTLRTLQLKDKIDADWKETALKLKKAIEHHIQEEESKIFTVARQVLTEQEATQMADAFERMKPELRNEGFMKNTIEIIANLMPPRFKSSVKSDKDFRV